MTPIAKKRIINLKIETDLERIRETAQRKEDENWEFRSFLKGYDIDVEALDRHPYEAKTTGKGRAL